MSPKARGVAALPASPQCFAIPLTTFLPFLYHTCTLRASCSTQSRSNPHHDRSLRRPFSTTTHRALDHDAIPFERLSEPSLPTDDPSSQGPALSYLRKIRQRPTRDTTMTHSEKAIFDRIFKDIATAGAVQHDDHSEPTNEEGGSYFENLDQIFDDAISQSEKHEESQDRPSTPRKYARHPLLLKIPGLDFLAPDLPPPKDWGLPGRLGSESISDLSTAHEQHRRKVFGMFDAAETDVAVWRILESEVFMLIHELNNRIKAAEKAAKEDKAAKGKKNGRPSKKSSPRGKAEWNTPKALQPTVLLSILNTEYPYYVLAAARLLRRSFPLSAYALAILPEVKRLGPVSYVLGATANVYNETLYLQWTSKKDLHGMASLLQEMRNQGVESNDVTATLLQGVQRRRGYELSGKYGVWRQKWWGMGPVMEAWGKLKVGMDYVLEEQQRERQIRAAEEEGQKKEEEDEDREEQKTEELEPFPQPAVQADA